MTEIANLVQRISKIIILDVQKNTADDLQDDLKVSCLWVDDSALEDDSKILPSVFVVGSINIAVGKKN